MLPLIVKLAGFLLAILPLLIDNLRTRRATNGNNLILLLGGLAMLALDRGTGWSDRSLLASGVWIIAGAAVLLVVVPSIGGSYGVAKTLIALLPWFTMESYFIVVSVGLFAAAAIGYATRRDAPVVAPLTLAGVFVLTL
ncbi:hypothetical protein JQ596_05125 [Bradyrhizobium manausense]|uniref:hypothetical protein n=1 Tax=Bradyrhizobium TaxID=374 RepID=UPI001BA78A8B|nr:MULTISPECIES: hypothetical protein [Bradyrhizobium]MBR0824909.1 hypothetical protein [Bradyrhizobium manausense]UVO29321.1 hypothetical protein KUF59_00650 [Bradyrhizobium arachidis]